MGKIIKPYYLATRQPEPFEKYLENIGFSEKYSSRRK